MTVYAPLVPNFALNKFVLDIINLVLDRIQQYLTQKEVEENVRIILTGGFNFPPRVINSEGGFFPKCKAR